MDDFAIEPSAQGDEFALVVTTNGIVPAHVVAAFLVAVERAIKHPEAYGPDAVVELVHFEQGSLKWIIKVVRGATEFTGIIGAGMWFGILPAELASFDEVRKAIEERIVAEMTVSDENGEQKLDLRDVLSMDRSLYTSPYGNMPRITDRVTYTMSGPCGDPPPPDDGRVHLIGILARSAAGELRFFTDDARLFAAELVEPRMLAAGLPDRSMRYGGRIEQKDYLPLFRIDEMASKPV